MRSSRSCSQARRLAHARSSLMRFKEHPKLSKVWSEFEEKHLRGLRHQRDLDALEPHPADQHQAFARPAATSKLDANNAGPPSTEKTSPRTAVRAHNQTRLRLWPRGRPNQPPAKWQYANIVRSYVRARTHTFVHM